MLVLAYVVSVSLMILLPVALAAGLRRVTPAPWLLFSIGSLTFILSQAVHLPLNDWLAGFGLLPAEGARDLPLWRTALILGLTAGLCEELARAAGYAALQKVKPAWLRLQDSLMLGLGHGGIEAMIFGGVLTAATLSALLPLRQVDLNTLGLPPEQLEALRLQLSMLAASPLNAVFPLLERLLAISAHVTFSLLVWQAFARGRFRRDWFYLPLAILYHAAIDFLAVWGAETFRENYLFGLLAFIAVLIPGWVWALWLVRRNWIPRPAVAGLQTGATTGSLRGEWRVFWAASLKELRQLWRTRRLLVMGAVFLIFGMGSPLLAKLTPELLSSIEGAEIFAELIPEPTAGDAMTQYIKNLAQFGFILAVLLGMGAVVGEKERGVAPMILSKPMPRWAFISSKFFAQFLMYLGGFILAGLGAYYYTLVLFGSLDFAGFALLNGLLLLWLLTFVALSLLGSTLGASTAASGGIGLALSVALMLAGTLPKYGALLPGGLMSWAAMIGQAAAGIDPPGLDAGPLALAGLANGGAAASALVVIVVAITLSLGIFEQQEL